MTLSHCVYVSWHTNQAEKATIFIYVFRAPTITLLKKATIQVYAHEKKSAGTLLQNTLCTFENRQVMNEDRLADKSSIEAFTRVRHQLNLHLDLLSCIFLLKFTNYWYFKAK